ncbi:MAG: hypothetical protein V1494_08280 [Candidatus Diapherotrites archaeon]
MIELAVATTVRIDSSLKNKLDKIKTFERESYSEVIERLVNMAEDDEPLSDDEIRQIERSLEDIKAGRVLPLKEAEKKWGI